jgi:hypothetical protein
MRAGRSWGWEEEEEAESDARRWGGGQSKTDGGVRGWRSVGYTVFFCYPLRVCE